MSSAFDPNFEFNAPKFHDFTNPSEDENADSWFDRLPDTSDETNTRDSAVHQRPLTALLTSDRPNQSTDGRESSGFNKGGSPQTDKTALTMECLESLIGGNSPSSATNIAESTIDTIVANSAVPGKLIEIQSTLSKGIENAAGSCTVETRSDDPAATNSTQAQSTASLGKDSIESHSETVSAQGFLKENGRTRKSSTSLEFSVASASNRSKKSFSDSSSTRSNQNLTDSILALAGFKQHEQVVRQIADSTVAEIASNPSMQQLASSVTGDLSLDSKPISSRTRSSAEGAAGWQAPVVPKLIFTACEQKVAPPAKQGARKLMAVGMGHGGKAEALKASDDHRRKSVAVQSKVAAKEAVPRSAKRTHVGSTVTPVQAKRARGINGEHHSRTPTFSRFATGLSDSTAARRCQSAPRSRPAAALDKGMTTPRSSTSTPRSSAEGLPGRSAARQDLTRPTMSSSRKAARRRESRDDSSAAAKTPLQLTVPYSPQLATSNRNKRRAQAEAVHDKSVASTDSASKHFTPGRLTVPRSPRLTQRSSSRPKTADSETLQLRQAEEALEQLRKRRKVGEERLRCVLEPRGEVGPSLRSTKELTVPVSPQLHTAARPSSRLTSCSTESMEAEAYVPLAERISKYNDRGPRSSVAPGETSHLDSHSKPRLTQPKTPDFSSFRRKEAKIKGFGDKEAEQLEEIKRHQFKARPLNKRVLESCGDLGVPRIDKKPLTNPREPQLRVSERAEVHRSRDSSMESLSEASFEFKARPAPRTVRDPPRVPAAQAPKSLTVPESPTLATKLRSCHRSVHVEESPEPSNAFKAAPMPDFSKSTYIPKHDVVALTEPSPFKLSTEERHKQYEEEMKRKIEAQRRSEEEARRFKANPIRAFAESNPKTSGSFNSKPALTETQPFNLQSEARHEHSKLLWEQQVEKELQQEREKFSSFQARAVPKTISSREDVFTPRRSSRALTEVDPFELNVDRRSREREHFEQTKLQRELKIEEERRQDEERRKEMEERETREMRRKLVVRARGVPSCVYTPSFDVQRSTKPLTEPHSPHLRTAMRPRSVALDG